MRLAEPEAFGFRLTAPRLQRVTPQKAAALFVAVRSLTFLLPVEPGPARESFCTTVTSGDPPKAPRGFQDEFFSARDVGEAFSPRLSRACEATVLLAVSEEGPTRADCSELQCNFPTEPGRRLPELRTNSTTSPPPPASSTRQRISARVEEEAAVALALLRFSEERVGELPGCGEENPPSSTDCRGGGGRRCAEVAFLSIWPGPWAAALTQTGEWGLPQILESPAVWLCAEAA